MSALYIYVRESELLFSSKILDEWLWAIFTSYIKVFAEYIVVAIVLVFKAIKEAVEIMLWHITIA